MVINCNGNILDLTQPKVMGIININHDSFYEGSRITEIDRIILKVQEFIKQGAAIVDLGAMSSRPGASLISHEKEWQILEPILSELKSMNIALSVDTVSSATARKAIESGASMINDISGGVMDENMIPTVAQYPVPYIMMHMKGTPLSMQDFTTYQNLIIDILSFFKNQISIARSHGMKDLLIDPGFGFSKNIDQNYELLNSLRTFNILGIPILVGLSRKSMLYKYLDIDADTSLNATTVVHTIALLNGAKILRVHDVKEAIEAVKLVDKIYNPYS